MIIIREEGPGDADAIRAVNDSAFGQPIEADIVDRLRETCPEMLSLVAILDGRVVGHALFSPAVIEGGSKRVQGMGLAPVSVLPEHQRQGIGSRLIPKGIGMLKERGCPFVIVLGHASYYPRFGFRRASEYGIRSQWEAPDEAFMVVVLDETVMSGVSGIARYRPEFDAAV